MPSSEGPEQDALFYIEGPEEDGCVYISSSEPGQWCHSLRPVDKVAEVLSQWLASIDNGESTFLTHDE
jgi:hypothetical protein